MTSVHRRSRKAKQAGGTEEESEGEMEPPTVAHLDIFLRHCLSSLGEGFFIHVNRRGPLGLLYLDKRLISLSASSSNPVVSQL